jgi:hypothetical protein
MTSIKGRFWVRFWVRIAIRFCARFPAQGGFQFSFLPMCLQAVIIGVQRIIENLNPLHANCVRNRTVIRMQNRTRVDGHSDFWVQQCYVRPAWERWHFPITPGSTCAKFIVSQTSFVVRRARILRPRIFVIISFGDTLWCITVSLAVPMCLQIAHQRTEKGYDE